MYIESKICYLHVPSTSIPLSPPLLPSPLSPEKKPYKSVRSWACRPYGASLLLSKNDRGLVHFFSHSCLGLP